MAITRALLEQQIQKADAEVKQAEASGNFALGFKAACQFFLSQLPAEPLAAAESSDPVTGD